MKLKKGYHWVKSHSWKGKTHPGYARKTRKKSGQTTLSKKAVRLYPIRDKKTGYILGYKSKR